MRGLLVHTHFRVPKPLFSYSLLHSSLRWKSQEVRLNLSWLSSYIALPFSVDEESSAVTGGGIVGLFPYPHHIFGVGVAIGEGMEGNSFVDLRTLRVWYHEEVEEEGECDIMEGGESLPTNYDWVDGGVRKVMSVFTNAWLLDGMPKRISHVGDWVVEVVPYFTPFEKAISSLRIGSSKCGVEKLLHLLLNSNIFVFSSSIAPLVPFEVRALRKKKA
ncbi:hypothetical protein CR513_22340, partial [Mucuna pruriens]